MRAAKRLQQLDLRRIVHDQLELQLRRRGQLPGVDDALEQHDRLGHARAAQRRRLLDAGDGEGIGAAQRQRDRHQTMSVGVRLDDRHDARLRRPRTQHLEVGAQRLRVDAGADQPHHLRTPSA